MKRIFLIVLMVCLLIAPARAAEAVDQPVEDNTQNPHVMVATLDELQEAIAAANDGDTIEIAQTIKIAGEDISTDKDITIACAECFEDSTMFRTREGSIVGLSFKGGRAKEIFAVVNGQEEKTIFQNCKFDGENVAVAVNIYGAIDISGSGKPNFIRIIDSEFMNCFRNAISARASTDVVVERCYVHDTYAMDASAAVRSSGKLTLNDCIITGNSSFANAGVLCSGTLIVSGGQIRDNTILSTEIGVAVDIFCSGTWSIIEEATEDAGYYDVTTGEKLSLPIHENDTLARLVYLKDEDAKEYFSFLLEPDADESDKNNIPELPQEPTQTPEEDETGNQTNQPDVSPQEPITPPTDSGESDAPEQKPEPPKESADLEGENDEGDSSDKWPETPDQPLHDEDGDSADNNTSQSPEQPTDPPLDDNITDTTPDTPQQPQEPIDIPYWLPVRPTQPIVITTTPTDEPKIEPEMPSRKLLICNGATIDTSKTIVLLGYGDGQLHESDSLTRAQLATIIFRLLDDDTVVRYGSADVMFTDVAADAWYAPYVNAIGMAGIVNGVGNGMYDPDGTVTWAQIITILTRFVESENCELKYIQYSGWALEAIQTAVALEWIEDSPTFNPNAIISRGELVDLINTVLERY